MLTQQPALEDWYDSNAAQGQFEGKSKEEIQAALNEEVAKGMMNISIAAPSRSPTAHPRGRRASRTSRRTRWTRKWSSR